MVEYILESTIRRPLCLCRHQDGAGTPVSLEEVLITDDSVFNKLLQLLAKFSTFARPWQQYTVGVFVVRDDEPHGTAPPLCIAVSCLCCLAHGILLAFSPILTLGI